MVRSHCPTLTQTPIQTQTQTRIGSIGFNSKSVSVSVSVQCEHLHTILYNPFFIGVCVSVGVRQCEHTIRFKIGRTQLLGLK